MGLFPFARSDRCVFRGPDRSLLLSHCCCLGFCVSGTRVASIMLVRALLQTSLVLWLTQQTLQGGVRPQSVSWGRVLPARGVGVGVKPGVTGALGALGSRYGSKAMKAGIGRYPGAQLGLGGYRALGLGGRAGLKQGGYGTPGAYGASLGTGMGLGAGLTNGLGLGLGQGGKRVYGAGLGTLPGYGAMAGVGYGAARPGASAADLGGPEVAGLGRAVQDLKREKSRALGHSYGKQDGMLGPETPGVRRSDILGAAAPELYAGRDVKSLFPVGRSSSLGPAAPLDKQSKLLGLAVSRAHGGQVVSNRKASHEAAVAAAGARRPASPQVHRDYQSSIQQNQRAPNCRSLVDLPDGLEINQYELLGSEIDRTQGGFVPQTHVGKEEKHLGRTTVQAQGERSPQLLPLQAQDGRSNVHSTPQVQGGRDYLSAAAERPSVKGLVAKGTNGLQIRGTVTVENRNPGAASLQTQGAGRFGPVNPGGAHSLGVASVRGGQEAQGFTADGQDVNQPPQADYKKSKALGVPGQTGRSNQATSYVGGAGNYQGASLGAGGYGAGLGQGAYLGGPPGNLEQRSASDRAGYGEGVTGYLGAAAGNGYGHGNGYGDGYGAGLGYPADLADVAESKARKSEALGTGGYAGQVQGAYGALGAGLESTAGKFAGAAQGPYGNAPVIPAGLEGDGGYPYAAQHLGAEGAKTANKYGAAAGYGPQQQTGYGAQLGVTPDGEQNGKYGGVNGALGNGYKG
ncbi:spidroin-1 [Brachyistius frenatus]|uniref:spidroin-1 n=1 Tax=Brachyistius frenatus TaxID=100188 RepID=UPI0037E810CB